jgi:hypothetical protein
MGSDDLLTALRRRPFVPFRLVTTDGTGYEIRHPEWLMPGKRSVLIGVHAQPDDPAYDQFVILSLLHVQRLEPFELASA